MAGDGTCFGDSGGPVVFKSKLIGVISHLTGDCKYPDIHVNIAFFQKWINSYIQPKTVVPMVQ